LIVNKYAYLTGGADRNCLALVGALRERGHEVVMVSTASERNVVDAGAFIGATVTHQSRAGLSLRARAAVLARSMWNPAAARAMRVVLHRFRPDVVHTHKLYPQLSAAPVVVAARAGVPVVQTLHDYELLSASALDECGGRVDRDESRMTYRWLNTATFPLRRSLYAPRIGAFVACSRYVAARYRDGLGIESTVLPYFVEPPEQASASFAERDGAVFVGRLHEEKGVLDVVELAHRLPELRVSVIGYGPLEDLVGEAACRLRNLDFLGRQNRAGVLARLGRARVSLMPSRWQEPGGIAALEAMSVGTPVVAYANGGLAEYVTDTDGGRVIPPGVDGLAAAVAVLHDDEALWRTHSDHATEGIARRHTAEVYVGGLEEVYRSVVEQRRATRPHSAGRPG